MTGGAFAVKPADVTEAARRWVGTPYHHQASVRGVGCDCLGLLRGVWRELVGEEPEMAPPYSPSWDEVQREEHMLRVCNAYLRPLREGELMEGAVMVFRMRPRSVAKHCGIIVPGPNLIHALNGRGVVEVTFNEHWERRVAGAFAFPGVV